MNATATITRVVCRWDDQPGVEPGWYCETWAGDTQVDDSQKVWFPVQVDNFGRDQWASLGKKLAKAFPHAEIDI